MRLKYVSVIVAQLHKRTILLLNRHFWRYSDVLCIGFRYIWFGPEKSVVWFIPTLFTIQDHIVVTSVMRNFWDPPSSDLTRCLPRPMVNFGHNHFHFNHSSIFFFWQKKRKSRGTAFLYSHQLESSHEIFLIKLEGCWATRASIRLCVS